ncbi:MAG: glucan 1,4-alpha-glucosidase [Candidatus Abyssobacteria bacterium SURF_5]|uniref:Glucan 1,4-alpha-glucosidase n=1 Tax=Abyssobacteria bacterium (strain SURF_5) TaxID=2093360 RepID=A0A3A4NN54_ABYX5|nr:MAG: glucan 1,4-alpha-glucosidase [Candidatus Abyssubacteria bacterium SURF_5]
MNEVVRYAPGQPGVPHRSMSGGKSGVGAALNPQSRVWFTIGHGILNEIYYPDLDRVCTKGMEFLISDGKEFFSEEQKDTYSEMKLLDDGVPAYRVINTCLQGRYRIEKEIFSDPCREVVLQHIRFIPLMYSLSEYRLFALLTPCLDNAGDDDTGFCSEYKGVPMLFAERDHAALALGSSAPWLHCSVGFVGVSDGWQQVHEHKRLQWNYGRAENGYIALTGEVDLQASNGSFILAIGFGRSFLEAAQRVRASLLCNYDSAKEQYTSEWRRWQETLRLPSHSGDQKRLASMSAAILRIHESKELPGGSIASLSIPWAFTGGKNDLGAYHLVWPRDMVQSAGALLALGARDDARRALLYLQATQERQGHWPQCMRLDGTHYCDGTEAAEAAYPILLAELARREEALEPQDLTRLWPMIKRAAGFIARTGPVNEVERWEEEGGYSPLTLAIRVAALLAAADFAEINSEPVIAAYLRETADWWNANLERWTYVKDDELARQSEVSGYYARSASPWKANPSAAPADFSTDSQAADKDVSPAAHVSASDALALVRFGLRMPDDRRIVDTLKVVDALLKVSAPQGPLWRRFARDTYGENEDGSAFAGNGKGRLWPLLAGERAHYELAAGTREAAESLLRTLEGCAGGGGMLPEQIWDSADIPESELYFGKPTGSAMPLVWAHAECLKLHRSLQDNHVFDLPSQTVQRYLTSRTDSVFAHWKKNNKIRVMRPGKDLRLELLASADVRWSSDNWKSINDSLTRETGVGIWVVELPAARLPANTVVRFTFYWIDERRWEGKDFEVTIADEES